MIKIMKTWKIFNLKRLGMRGQSLVEFVLLLAAIASLSFLFVTATNKYIARYWKYSVNLIVNDHPTDGKKIELR
jgi:hypothetical protein